MENNKSSVYRGVSWAKKNRKWIANLYLRGQRKNQYGGMFSEEEDAARRVDEYEMDQQVFDKLNFYDSERFVSICETSASARHALTKHLAKQGQAICQNSSNLRGVTFGNTASRPFKAQIYRNGVQYHLGRYNTPEKAHAAFVAASQAYDTVTTLRHGDASKLFSDISTDEAAFQHTRARGQRDNLHCIDAGGRPDRRLDGRHRRSYRPGFTSA